MPPPETRTITVDVDEHTCTLAVEALRGEADRRRRAGVEYSAELVEAKRAGTDIRSQALQVVAVLGEADSLAHTADRLHDAWAAAAGEPAAQGAPKPTKRRRPPAARPSSAADGDGSDPPAAIEHGDDPLVAAARAELLGQPPDGTAPAVAAAAGTPEVP